MKQTVFNIYFTVSVLFLTTGLILALTDQERQLIDNAGFLSVLLLSALNFIYAINLFFKVPE